MSGGQTVHTDKPSPRRRATRVRKPRGDDLLYRCRETPGGAVRYDPWGRAWDRESLPLGCTLVINRPSSVSYRTLDPQVTECQAALLAASELAAEAMVRAMMEASRERPVRLSTDREHQAWHAYCRVLGEPGGLLLERSSAQQIVNAGLQALRDAVERCRATDELLGAETQESEDR